MTVKTKSKGGVLVTAANRSGGGRDSSVTMEEEEEHSFLAHFFLGEAEEVAADDLAADKRRRREQQEEAYRKVLRERKERRDELRKVFVAQADRLCLNADRYPNGYMVSRGYSYVLRKNLKELAAASKKEDEAASEEEEECVDLEPFFFDEAAAVAEHAAGEEKRRREAEEEQEEAREQRMLFRRAKVHKSVLNSITYYDHKRKRSYYRRFHFADLSTFDLDEESPLGPMRYAGDDAFHLHGTVCKQGEERFLLNDAVNVLSVKIASSDVGFPVSVYGTVIARDRLDEKCVYLFRRDRNHFQLINSEDDLLILTGPKRGLVLKSYVYFEMDLKIKSDQGQKDKQLSNGFLTLDFMARLPRYYRVETDSLDTKLSSVEVTYAAVRSAVEATITVEVVNGESYGKITACATNIQNSMVLHDSEVADLITCDSKRFIQLLRPVVAVSTKEQLEVTVVAQTGDGEVKSSIIFTPRASSVDEDEVTCGSVKMLVKVYWSIIACEPWEVTH